MFVPVHYTLFWCSSSLHIPPVDEEKDIMRYLVRKELKGADKMDSFITEEGRDESVHSLSDFCMH